MDISLPPTTHLSISMELTKDINAGQAVYSKFVLSIYDIWVFGVSNHYIWKCPTHLLLQNYNRHISGNHLDIGVGSGFLLDKCRFPTPNPKVTLLDLNENSLNFTAARIKRYRPTIHKGNIFDRLSVGGRKFDSVGFNYVLHCLPGTMQSKAVVFDNIQEVLGPAGVLFGATLVQHGVPMSWSAKILMAIYNRKGIFTNTQDSSTGLEQILSEKFSRYSIELRGCVAIYAATV